MSDAVKQTQARYQLHNAILKTVHNADVRSIRENVRPYIVYGEAEPY